MKNLIILLALALSFSACANEDNDLVDKVDKEGSIEVRLTTTRDEFGVQRLKAIYTVWHKGQIHKTFEQTEELPGLGTMSTEDDNGNLVQVPKEYEFYVTLQ